MLFCIYEVKHKYPIRLFSENLISVVIVRV